MIYPHSQAFQHLHLSLSILMLVVLWNEANHDPFLELVLWHSFLLTALYISGSYIFLVINMLLGSMNDQNKRITKVSLQLRKQDYIQFVN